MERESGKSTSRLHTLGLYTKDVVLRFAFSELGAYDWRRALTEQVYTDLASPQHIELISTDCC